MNGWLEFTLTAAFLAGLSGGAHCAAMCGPLVAIAGGWRASSPGATPFLARALAYNAGRLTSYCAAGAAAGALGAASLGTRADPAVQSVLLAAMSATLILMAACVAGVGAVGRVLESAGAVLWRRIEPCARHFLPAHTMARTFGLGLVWGWLPCGMVYLALVAAAASADPVHGAALMAAFGLGTLPNLIAIAAWFRHVVTVARGGLARRFVAAVMAGAGVAGIAAALKPELASAAGSWCLQLPGIASVFGGGG